MKYTEYRFAISPQREDAADVLAAMLGECGFETFVSTDEAVTGYVQDVNVDEEAVREAADTVAAMLDVQITYTSQAAPDENWNATWEQEGFRPIVIGSRLTVHSTEHTDVPPCDYDIAINPCMAFGTGSHDTTRMLLTWLLDHDVTGKVVIDAGCGTGILGILAKMRGAGRLLAYDIDEWSVRNAQANLALNGMAGEVRLGDSACIDGERCDLLIANINRNILLADMPRFAESLNDGGTMLLSGFYRADVGALTGRAELLGLVCEGGGHSQSEGTEYDFGDWCWLQFSKMA